MGSIPGWETKILRATHTMWPKKKKDFLICHLHLVMYVKCCFCPQKAIAEVTCLAVQWLSLHFQRKGAGFISGRGTKISHATRSRAKK